MQKLKQVQNRILTGLRKFDYISPSLNDLGWLLFKDLLLHRDLIFG